LNPALKRRIDQIRRRWWLVLAAAVLGILAALLPALTEAPTYVGKSALVMSSPGRAPEQDTMMVVGYSTMFNEPVTINRLEGAAGLPDNVTYEARTVAASPILIIQATAENAQLAQDAAQKMAEAFRDDVNSVRQKGNEQSVQDLQAQLEALRAEPTPEGLANPALAAVQDRINALQFDSTNQLQDLQLRAGVVEIQPNLKTNLALGAIGGLVLGLLGAVGLGSLSTRLTSSSELRDKTGVEPLVEVPSAGARKRNRLRQDRLRTLANIVSLRDLPKPGVIAFADSAGVHGARALAEELAKLMAQQRNRTVLVYADNEKLESADGAGFNEALAGTSPVPLALEAGGVDALTILPPGSVHAERYANMTPARITALLDELRTEADTIIIAAPPFTDSAETQLICGAADSTILVVSTKSSRSRDVSSAREALDQAHAALLGAVLIDDAQSAKVATLSQSLVNESLVESNDGKDDTVKIDLEPSMVGRNGWDAH
jgi:polysaccharide biosynthesis transport protein